MNRTTQPQTGAGGSAGIFLAAGFEARRFYLNLNPPKRVPLAVVSGGCEHCAPDYEIHRATFPFYSIEYVVRGRGSLKLQNAKPRLAARHGFFLRPRRAAGHRCRPGTIRRSSISLTFDGLKSRGILRQCRLPPGGVSQIFPPNEIQNLFDELIRVRPARLAPERRRFARNCWNAWS